MTGKLKFSNSHSTSKTLQFWQIAITSILVNAAYGQDTFFEPGYDSLLDLQSKRLPGRVGNNIPGVNDWNDIPDEPLREPRPPTRQKFEKAEIQREEKRLSWGDSPQNPVNHEDSPMVQKQLIHDIIASRSSLSSEYASSSGEDNLVTFGTSIWNKRGAGDDAAKVEKTNPVSETKEGYEEEDKFLENLVPDKDCLTKLPICANHLNKYDCTMNCYLNQVLESPNTKFLYRLIHQFKSFGRFLCPTFGTIYDDIPNIIHKRLRRNKLSSFLQAVGIQKEVEQIDLDFIKNSPLALFNSLVKFGNGTEFDIIKPILGTAEATARAEMSGRSLSASLYSNPVCSGVALKSWIYSIINTLTKHPLVSDIFLKGFWTITRALNNGVPYPLDGLFTSWMVGIKVLAGAECSLISYAEQGKRFKCLQKAPIEQILDDYKKEAEKRKNPFDWLVCGAHQVKYPKWFKSKVKNQEKKNEFQGRSDTGDEEEEVGVEGDEPEEEVEPPVIEVDPAYDVVHNILNPEEFYNYEDESK
ncbi:hypothetical protein Ocin01_00376 [Orchesella cincta]|uniref:Uncharacterized protein n=1 Tax=Orchesella cincta TaxID=48709 RepID=A0A1D2NM97_ORCCI|nr:hypothetical protein Ocin01_00376 [Orchesella cincta]